MKKITTLILALHMAAPAFAGQKIVVEGSTTVLPIAQKAAEEFMKLDKDADISIRGGGSGVGIASIIDGTCDIADASRAVKPSELEKAAKKGRDLVAHVIAMDGISHILHPSNPMKGLTREQIKKLYTTRVKNWKEIGGPDLKLVVISRDSASGTFEAFSELVLDKKKVRPDAIMQASNQGIASIVARTPGAIGYVGLGYVTDSVKAIAVDGVMPDKESVIRNKYAISRPLFMYTAGKPEGLVKKFLDYVKGPEGRRIVEEQGFVALKK
ncbi:MAG TPA: phosphate ABC transporter substrate-binding protein [Elusimicrobia bacterium]|jgi:phosphate transport system substrate-binding protein|nr:phosphate ABC transporter substrate-binding protein [Elusimicrobiota bacterium]